MEQKTAPALQTWQVVMLAGLIPVLSLNLLQEQRGGLWMRRTFFMLVWTVALAVFPSIAVAATDSGGQECILKTSYLTAESAVLYDSSGNVEQCYDAQKSIDAKALLAKSLFAQGGSTEGYNILEKPHDIWRADPAESGLPSTQVDLKGEILGVFPSCPSDVLAEIMSIEPTCAHGSSAFYIIRFKTDVYQEYSRRVLYTNHRTRIDEFSAIQVCGPASLYVIVSFFEIDKKKWLEYSDVDTSSPRTFLVVKYVRTPNQHSRQDYGPESAHLSYRQSSCFNEKGEEIPIDDHAHANEVIRFTLQEYDRMPVDKSFPGVYGYRFWSLDSVFFENTEPTKLVWENGSGTHGAQNAGSKVLGEESALRTEITRLFPSCPTSVVNTILGCDPREAYRRTVKYSAHLGWEIPGFKDKSKAAGPDEFRFTYDILQVSGGDRAYLLVSEKTTRRVEHSGIQLAFTQFWGGLYKGDSLVFLIELDKL